MQEARPAKTIADYMRLPEGARVELIKGELLSEPSPRYGHQGTVGELYVLIRAWANANDGGKVVVSPFDVHLPSGDVVQPDLVFVAKPHLDLIKGWVMGVPDLLIEVLSPENPERDLLIKRDLYAANGVPEYWIVDPDGRTVQIFQIGGGGYGLPTLYEAADTVTSTLLPGLAIPVAGLFPLR